MNGYKQPHDMRRFQRPAISKSHRSLGDLLINPAEPIVLSNPVHHLRSEGYACCLIVVRKVLFVKAIQRGESFERPCAFAPVLSRAFCVEYLCTEMVVTSCIVPESGGVEFRAIDHDTLWDRYYTAAPEQLRQYGPLSSVVRKAYKA